MEVVQLPQDYRALKRDSLFFITESPGVPGTHLIDLRKMKE